MSRISDLEVVVPQVKSLLRKYLEDNGTKFKNNLFTCPNREEHANGDAHPSCGFIPETNETVAHCFSCGFHSDIFGAYAALEGKAIKGIAFHEAVKTLCDKYHIEYQTVPLTPIEEEAANVQTFLQKLVTQAHAYLVMNKPEQVIDYIKSRKWEDVIETFQFGYIPDTTEMKEKLKAIYIKAPYLREYIELNPTQIVDRLIYPIKDTYGSIIGLMDRSIAEDDFREKYQKYFMKDRPKASTLFNLQEVYPEIYLVEGASSVFTLYQYGIKNCVALLGLEFSETMYKLLVKHRIQRVTICLDGDDRGIAAMQKIIKFFSKHPDIKASVKFIPGDKDPDEYIQEYGVDDFKKIPEESIFNYQLRNFKNTADELQQEEYRKSLFEILNNTKDIVSANKLIEVFCRELNVPKKTILEELQKHSNTSDIGVATIIAEENHLLGQIDTFEDRAWRAGKLIGIPTGFPLLDSKIDGLQEGLILVSGKWNVGKSAFLHSLTLNMLKDPTNYIIYFSIDDSVLGTTIPRFLANLSVTPINTIANPIHQIEQNETLTPQEKTFLKEQREKSIELLKTYSGRLGIKDSSEGMDVKYIEKTIKTYRTIAGNNNLIVIVDFLNMVQPLKGGEKTEQESVLAGFFKQMANTYHCPVICTVESTKEILKTKTSEDSIKGSSSIQFRSNLTLLFYSDFEIEDQSKMFFYDDNGNAFPLVKVRVSKNKFAGFKGDIYYKFYKNYSRFEECTEEEQEQHRRSFQ